MLHVKHSSRWLSLVVEASHSAKNRRASASSQIRGLRGVPWLLLPFRYSPPVHRPPGAFDDPRRSPIARSRSEHSRVREDSPRGPLSQE